MILLLKMAVRNTQGCSNLGGSQWPLVHPNKNQACFRFGSALRSDLILTRWSRFCPYIFAWTPGLNWVVRIAWPVYPPSLITGRRNADFQKDLLSPSPAVEHSAKPWNVAPSSKRTKPSPNVVYGAECCVMGTQTGTMKGERPPCPLRSSLIGCLEISRCSSGFTLIAAVTCMPEGQEEALILTSWLPELRSSCWLFKPPVDYPEFESQVPSG